MPLLRRCTCGRTRAGDDLEGGEGVVRGERHGCARHRPWVTVAERDRGELQRLAEGRAALIGDLRHAGRGEAASGPVESALQPPADLAGAGQADPGGICSGGAWRCLRSGSLRSPALRHRQAWMGSLRCSNFHNGWTDESDPVIPVSSRFRRDATDAVERFVLLSRLLMARRSLEASTSTGKCRSAERLGDGDATPGNAFNDFGFRVARAP
jgi:hypothetical protein